MLQIGQAIFFRHGETKYTDEFPDLTEAGKATIRETGAQIARLVNGHKISVVSSPMARARGSANIVANAIGYEEKIHIDPLVRTLDVHDPKMGKTVFEEHFAKGGIPELSKAYFSDPRYDDPDIFEPRYKVQERFRTYLARLVAKLLDNKQKQMLVVTATHYEVICEIIEKMFRIVKRKKRPLLHGEIVLIKFYPAGDRNSVILEVHFRGKTSRAFFDHGNTKQLIY